MRLNHQRIMTNLIILGHNCNSQTRPWTLWDPRFLRSHLGHPVFVPHQRISYEVLSLKTKPRNVPMRAKLRFSRFQSWFQSHRADCHRDWSLVGLALFVGWFERTVMVSQVTLYEIWLFHQLKPTDQQISPSILHAFYKDCFWFGIKLDIRINTFDTFL